MNQSILDIILHIKNLSENRYGAPISLSTYYNIIPNIVPIP